MNHKICRVCWNTQGWRSPSGSASGIETNSYVSENGFGHEEWLFNYEWLIDGYKYGFLQPIGKYRETYEGQYFDILLYTISPEKARLLVGVIRSVYVPTRQQLSDIVAGMRERGWIGQMQEDCAAIGLEIEEEDLGYPNPGAIINIRFRPEDVELYDPMPIAMDGLIRSTRYQPLDWDVEAGELVSRRSAGAPDMRSETNVLRASQQATEYSPRHVRLQNRLYKGLCKKYGKSLVGYEHEYVDLSLRTPEGLVFFEIKMEATARKCIRLALGQLLEYAHYPEMHKAVKLVVVGDAPLTKRDAAYMAHLGSLYAIPISYATFSWEDNSLKGWV